MCDASCPTYSCHPQFMQYCCSCVSTLNTQQSLVCGLMQPQQMYCELGIYMLVRCTAVISHCALAVYCTVYHIHTLEPWYIAWLFTCRLLWSAERSFSACNCCHACCGNHHGQCVMLMRATVHMCCCCRLPEGLPNTPSYGVVMLAICTGQLHIVVSIIIAHWKIFLCD